MADERMIPLYKDGQPVELAMTERDFFTKKTMRKDGGDELQTAAEAGYSLGAYYEDNAAPYDGPKTKRAYESQQEERRAARTERSAARAEAPKAEAPVEAPKAEARKD